MKRFLTVVLAVSLAVVCAGAALGAPPPKGVVDIDTWFSVEDIEPYFTFNMMNTPDIPYTYFSGEYYQNDFLFLSGSYTMTSIVNVLDVRGSYIWGNGFFVAFDVNQSVGTLYTISPGYRWSWNDRGYLAFSLDYATVFGVTNYEVALKYRTDALLIKAIVAFDPAYGWNYGGSLDYLVADRLTVGVDIPGQQGLDDWEVGATWKPGPCVFDLAYDDQGDYWVSAKYYLGGFGFGLEYDGKVYCLKAKYETDTSQFTALFSPEQPIYGMYYELSYTMRF